MSFCLSSYLLIYLQIIKRYYGRREISDEDLERALQVGMTPHERRRFEKKRGFSFRYSMGSTPTVPKQDNHAGCTPRMSNVDTLKVDAHNGSYANEEIGEVDGELLMKKDDFGNSTLADEETSEVDSELLMRKDDFGNSTLASDITVNGDVSAAFNGNMITDETTDYNGSSDSAVNVDDSPLSTRQANGLSDLSCPPNDERLTHSEHNSKLSLLGHGPHGKQVVEHLLKEYGENGIRDFCQRWRQVFVDAVKPRFLPGGWDVKHRYAMTNCSSTCFLSKINLCSTSIYFI